MSLETPHIQQSLPRQERLEQRARSQDRAPYRGWYLLTAHGTRPTRLAQMSVCKVIQHFVLVCFSHNFGANVQQLYEDHAEF